MPVTMRTEVNGDRKRKLIYDENQKDHPPHQGITPPDEQTSLFEVNPEELIAATGAKGSDGTLWCLCRHLRVHLGLLFAVTSCLFQSLGSMAVKMLAGRIAPTQAATFRLFFYFFCSALLIIYYRVPVRLTKRQARWLLFRAVIGTTGMCLCFTGYQNIPVGDTTAILFSSPIITGILAWILLGEKFTLFDAFLAVVTLTGITLVARPTFIFGDLDVSLPEEGNATLGIVASLVGAFVVSMVYISVRKLGGINVHPLLQISVFGIVGMVITCVLSSVLGVWVMPRCGQERLILLLSSSLGFLAQVFMTYAFMHEKATHVAMAKSNVVIFSFTFEFLLFGTVPYWLSVMGASLILGSCILLTLKKWRSANLKKDEEGISEDDDDDDDGDDPERNPFNGDPDADNNLRTTKHGDV